ncbi:hypothetical protein Y1Q_0004652 [Alligator mississippiensis]|uniref:Uncharacterized protein n=1 Tax=Alligator mississippiensis TaxID=8496 RepID=A0A151MHW3_ALLMI|nr:hypothetical protein Y1Q_0004652 [Alligator mississippiensis]
MLEKTTCASAQNGSEIFGFLSRGISFQVKKKSHNDSPMALVSHNPFCSTLPCGHAPGCRDHPVPHCPQAFNYQPLGCLLDSSKDANDADMNITMIAVYKFLGLQPCHFWASSASQDYWHHVVQLIWSDNQWLNSFQELLYQLRQHLGQQPTTMRPPVPKET